jgi:cytochrome c5
MLNRFIVVLGLLSLVSVAYAAPPQKPVKSRGQMLYENHCLRCHAEGVHLRATSKVHSLDDLAHAVKKWAGLQRLDWHQDELRDVADYMNRKYYKLKK